MQINLLEINFKGLDLSQEPDNLAPGYLQQADNVVLDGVDILTRPGLTALLTSAHSSGIFAYTPLVATAGSEKALYAADSKLMYWAGSNTASQVTSSGTVAHASAQIATLPGAAFLVDGTANLKRIPVDSGGVPGTSAAITELDRPTAPSVEAYSPVLNELAPADWAADTFSGANTNLCANGIFAGADTSGSDLGDYWKIVAGTPKAFDNADASLGDLPTITGGKWLRLDDPGDVVSLAKNAAASTVYLDNGYAENAKWSSSGDLKRWCTRFLFKARAVKIGSAAKSFHVRIQFYNSDATPTDTSAVLYEHTETVTITAQGKDELVRFMVDTSDYVQGTVRYMRLYLLPDPTSAVTNDGPYITDVSFQAVHPYWDMPSPALTDAGFIPVTDDTNILSGLYLACDYSGSINATGKNSLSLILNVPAVFTPAPSVEFKFADSSGNIWTSPSTDFGSTIEIDITQMPASIKADIAKFAMVFRTDAIVSGLTKSRTPASTRCAFYIVSLNEPGNLLAERDYWYVLAEVDDAGDSTLINVIHSDGSAPTAAVKTTLGQRMSKLTLPARANSGSEYLALYRFGGSYLPQPGDPALPTGRLLCWVSWSAATFAAGGDTQKPTSPASGYPVVFANPYISWTKTGSTGDAGSILIDNTPDSWLSGADTYAFGREKAPTAPESVAAWDNRLWLAKGADLYASWDIAPGRDAGIYWTRTAESTATDPEAPVKGWWVRLRLTPGDSIKKILPMGDTSPAMLVLSRFSAFAVTRSGARAYDRQSASGGDLYTITELEGEDVGGVVGNQAACVFDQSAWWLSDRALLRWQRGNRVQNVGDAIRRYLPGPSPSISYHASALPLCSLCASPHFLYLSIPAAAGDTSPNRTLVWHDREKGWTRWTLGTASGSGEILAGFDGQLRRIGGSGDVATVGAGASSVTATVRTRRIGDGRMVSNPGLLFYSLNQPGATAATVTFTVLGDGTTNGTIAQSVLGDVSRRVRASRSGAGRKHDITASWPSVERLRLSSVGLDLLPSNRRRV